MQIKLHLNFQLITTKKILTSQRTNSKNQQNSANSQKNTKIRNKIQPIHIIVGQKAKNWNKISSNDYEIGRDNVPDGD